MTIGVYKRIILALAFVLAACSPLFANIDTQKVLPAEATINSIYSISVIWNDEDLQKDIDIRIMGLGTDLPMYIDTNADPGPKKTLYRLCVSAGLNLSSGLHEPDYEKDADGKIVIDEITKQPIIKNPYMLILDPNRQPIRFAPNLISDGAEMATVNFKIHAHVTYIVDPKDTDPNAKPQDPKDYDIDMSVKVHGSSMGGQIAYGAPFPGQNRDMLDTYPGRRFPYQFGPDPLVTKTPWFNVPPAITPDDGASSTTYEFRVMYQNRDGLPPKPWLPFWADEFDEINQVPSRDTRTMPAPSRDMNLRETGVVLYLDVIDPFDMTLPADRREFCYRPHFMRPENPGSGDYNSGVVYYYRLQPSSYNWEGDDIMHFYHPCPFKDNYYVAMKTGMYHYFFACSDDSLTFQGFSDKAEKYNLYVGDFQRDPTAWGQWDRDTRGYTRSSTFLDPSMERLIVDGQGIPILDDQGNQVLHRPAGRQYSDSGIESDDVPMDNTVFVDRVDLVPGMYEGANFITYQYPGIEHPVVTVGLEGFPGQPLSGGDRYLDTVQPYNRAVNPLLQVSSSDTGFGIWGDRSETSGATTATMMTFRVKYTEKDNKPPVSIKIYINNQSMKYIDYSAALNAENGGYTGYTMTPSAIQPDQDNQNGPYDYTRGVVYEYKTKLPAGPHTYYFMASDGIATALFPARADRWVYLGNGLGDAYVPACRTGSETEFDNNYFPVYVNHPCQLVNPSVSPATGLLGKNFTYRVMYKDADGQRPYQASVYIKTGVKDSSNNEIVIKANMVPENPWEGDYVSGVWYVLDTATMQNVALAEGTRQYRFEFIDDWGRPVDVNDRIPGEITNYPANGSWIDGPSISSNVPPTLRNGVAVSTDGTSNGATIWKFTVDYKDLNNDHPEYVNVYIGRLMGDGQIKWDNGHVMSQADSGDRNYADGAAFVYQTRLDGAAKDSDPAAVYYYAFEAADASSVARWVPANNASASESAGCMLADTLTTDGGLIYKSNQKPLVGTLVQSEAGTNVLIDPVVKFYQYTNGNLVDTQIVARDDVYTVPGGVQAPTVVGRIPDADPAYMPAWDAGDAVVGVYTNAECTGKDYYHAADGTGGVPLTPTNSIVLAQALPYGTAYVWIKYQKLTGWYTLNRFTGEFTLKGAPPAGCIPKADYYFGTRMEQSLGVNKAPILSNPSLSALTGSSNADYVYKVDYKETEGLNGQAPEFVRVVIDGVAHDMIPVVSGQLSYRSGVTYKYTGRLASGSHEYYFTASDGAALVTLPAATPQTGDIVALKGPWVNNPPTLSNGLANPNPTGSYISTEQTVDYTVMYNDSDNDGPIAAAPVVYIDNPNETVYKGKVDSLVDDPADAGKKRSIKIVTEEGETPSYTAGELAGKLLQFTSGDLAGQVYLIVNNSSDTLRLMVDDLATDGVTADTTFTIAALQMYKSDPSQQSYSAGVTYHITVPQLAEGKHKFHFKAASTLTPPSWLPAEYRQTQSAWVRYPSAGEVDGPDVTADIPTTNQVPLVWVASGQNAVAPVSGKTDGIYTFSASYKDDDGNPPRYHDRVLGYVWLVFDDGTYTAEMSPVIAEDVSDSSFYKTARAFTLVANGLPEGTHRFHFEASDGWVKTRWPERAPGADPTINDPTVTVNAKAKLENITVNPPSGNANTRFKINLKYTDANNLPPTVQSGKEQVWVEIGSADNKLYLTRSASSTGFSSGVTYSGETVLSVGTYATTFNALDNANELTSVAGPSIRVSSNDHDPVLAQVEVSKVGGGSDEVNDTATGGTVDTFRYKVKYSDADGDIPMVVQNGVPVEGVELYIDGKFEAVLTQKTGTDYVTGVTYTYDKSGRTFQAGDHTYYVKATDGVGDGARTVQSPVTSGPTIVAANISLAYDVYDETSLSWEERSPRVGERVRVSGSLTGAASKPIPAGATLAITVAMPDSTSEVFNVTCASDNTFSFERVVGINKFWTITARWAGNASAGYSAAITRDIRVDVKGPTKVIATTDLSVPSLTAPVIDMISMPLDSPDHEAGSLFGYDRANLLRIVKWDPEQKTYLKYGETFFPEIQPGSAVWIFPSDAYPAEAVDPNYSPAPAVPGSSISDQSLYRLLKPFGRLIDQITDREITISAGWNQIGCPFLRSTEIKNAKVIYKGQTVSLAEAASKGWIRDYAWMWDSSSQTYKLIHATRTDAYGKTFDPWRGYWIRSFVDCKLVMAAPSASAQVSSIESVRKTMSSESLPQLDTPPAAPQSAGR